VSLFLIREALQADISAIEAIEREQFSSPWNRDQIKSEIDFPGSGLFVAETQSGQVAGYISFRLLPPEAELLRVAVSRENQRKGMAAALLAETIEKVKSGKVREIHLEVREGNRVARAFYESFSFLCLGRRPAYYSFPTEDACLYRLVL